MKRKSVIQTLCVLSLLVGLVAPPLVSQAAPTEGAISGTASYSGSQDTNHDVLVAAHLDIDSGPIDSVHIPGPGAYILEDLPDGDYYISAFLDIYDRGDGPPEFGEPSGWYDADGAGTPDKVTVNGGNITGIDITMTEPTDEYIQGTACYFGGAQGSGSIEIGLHTAIGAEPVTFQYLSALPCADYIFSGGPAGTYYISMFYDLDGSNGPPDSGEPVAYYDADGDGNPDPIIYTNNLITDVNITIGKIRQYVDFSATGSDDGTSWDNAYPDLQDAITAAEPGEEIWVAAGLYTPGTTREASFELQHEVAVYGGFNGTEDYRHQRNPRANITILSGEIGNPSIKTDNTYHVITTASTNENRLDETAVLDGFTITGGYADHFDNPNDKGGGFLNNFGTPTLVNLNFVDNYALNHGGAIVTQYNSNPLTVINSTFSGNRATNNAGGIANLAKIKVVNSSLVGNLGGNGGAIVGLSGTQTEVYNSILWDNQGNDISLQGTATATVTYSIVEGGFASGTNILVGNPLFVDADGLDDVYGTLDDDLHLQSASPAIDAGDNNELLADVADSNGNDNTTESIPVDFEGGSRLVDDPATPNTGNGSPPVDMGVDEFESPAAIMGLSAASSPSTLLGDATIFAARILSGTQTAYSWDFGDGNYSNNGAVSHTYTLPGVYQVVLSAVNSLGGQQAYATVTISEAMLTNPGDNVSTTDGVLTFEIPDSATGSMTFTYTPQTAATQPLGNFEFGGVSFQLLAVDNIGNPISEPGTPITLILRYDESALPPGTIEANLELHRFDDATMQWVALTVLAHDTSTNTITVMLDHFSEFALLLEQYRIYLPILLK